MKTTGVYILPSECSDVVLMKRGVDFAMPYIIIGSNLYST